jgi:cytochrome c-type biogenesis protein
MIEQFSSLLARLKRHLATVERAMGVLVVLTGIGFFNRIGINLQHLADGNFSGFG